jgi:hypothetical protein
VWVDEGSRARGDVVVGRTWSTGGDRTGCSRADLSALLRSRTWGRLVFHGHVSAGDRRSPTSTALQLARDGVEPPVATTDGRALEGPRDTAALSARVWLHEPGRWPLPRRVGFVACQADDAGYVEQTGLTLAALNAGARLVTTTRWTLPTDATAATDGAIRPTTSVAVAVDRALRAPDPVLALRAWQLDRLDAWRTATDLREQRLHAPLLWAALVTYVVPDELTSTPLTGAGG